MSFKIEEKNSLVREILEASAKCKLEVADKCIPSILSAARLITDSFKSSGKLLICGNGGSAADAQHFAAEFVGRLTGDYNRPALPAIALTTDSSILTAWSNDFSFNEIFARQIQAIGKKEDVLFGISTSGNSPNVIRAVEEAKLIGMKTVSLCGDGGKLSSISDIYIAVPSKNGQQIQESHLAIEHILCHLIEREINEAR